MGPRFGLFGMGSLDFFRRCSFYVDGIATQVEMLRAMAANRVSVGATTERLGRSTQDGVIANIGEGVGGRNARATFERIAALTMNQSG